MTTTGEKLMALRARAGMSLDEVASRAGYRGRSGVQRYFSPEFDKRLDVDVAVRFSEVFSGRGDPPIGTSEIVALAGGRLSEVMPAPDPAPRYFDLPRDVPVYGTAIGTYVAEDVLDVIEQTILHQGEPIDYFSRPPGALTRKGIYGVYVAGSSQSPRFEEGEIAFLDPSRPPMVGDDVVVYLVGDNGDDGERLVAVLIKRLLRRTASHIELRQFNPPLDFKVSAQRVSAIHRVLTNAEMLASR